MPPFVEIGDSGFEQAAAKFNTFGSLGVTADDHLSIGSSPQELLVSNPGKTLGELMTEDEISRWIDGQQKQIAEYSSDQYKNVSFVRSILPKLIEDLRLSKEYLNSIGKLPCGQNKG